MSMKHKQLSRAEVIARMQQEKVDKHVVLGARVGMMVCICVLWDYFDMRERPEDMDLFIDKCMEFMQAYEEGRLNIEETMDALKEQVGIDMLGEWRAKN